jgi:hypothetical protein
LTTCSSGCPTWWDCKSRVTGTWLLRSTASLSACRRAADASRRLRLW